MKQLDIETAKQALLNEAIRLKQLYANYALTLAQHACDENYCNAEALDIKALRDEAVHIRDKIKRIEGFLKALDGILI